VALVIAAEPATLATPVALAKIEATLDHVQMLDNIPRNVTGKVNRQELQRLARVLRGN